MQEGSRPGHEDTKAERAFLTKSYNVHDDQKVKQNVVMTTREKQVFRIKMEKAKSQTGPRACGFYDCRASADGMQMGGIYN
jgi:hypothetical protein